MKRKKSGYVFGSRVEIKLVLTRTSHFEDLEHGFRVLICNRVDIFDFRMVFDDEVGGALLQVRRLQKVGSDEVVDGVLDIKGSDQFLLAFDAKARKVVFVGGRQSKKVSASFST